MAAAVVGVLRMTWLACRLVLEPANESISFPCFVSEAFLLSAKSFGHVSHDGRMFKHTTQELALQAKDHAEVKNVLLTES